MAEQPDPSSEGLGRAVDAEGRGDVSQQQAHMEFMDDASLMRHCDRRPGVIVDADDIIFAVLDDAQPATFGVEDRSCQLVPRPEPPSDDRWVAAEPSLPLAGDSSPAGPVLKQSP
ncbi:MAG: hypothetical protein U0572_16130 [Phycisphaerales bacterium]